MPTALNTAMAKKQAKNGEGKPRQFKLNNIFATEDAMEWYTSRESLGSNRSPARYIPIFGGEPGKAPIYGLGHIVKRLGRPLTLEEVMFLVSADGHPTKCDYLKTTFQPVKYAIITKKWLNDLEDREPEVISDTRPRFAGAFFQLRKGDRRFAFSGANCVRIPVGHRNIPTLFWDTKSPVFLAGRYMTTIFEAEELKKPEGDRRYHPYAQSGEVSNPEKGRTNRFNLSAEAEEALSAFMVGMSLASPQKPEEYRPSDESEEKPDPKKKAAKKAAKKKVAKKAPTKKAAKKAAKKTGKTK